MTFPRFAVWARLSAFSLLLLGACDGTSMPPVCKLPAEPSLPAMDASNAVVTPESLAPLLFKGNLSVHQAALALRSAKEQVNLARLELLPSINLGTLLLAAGQPQFAWTGVEAALPFLIPANWFKVGQAKKLFEAQKLSLQILEQNQFAQAYSLIRIWQVDGQLLEHVEEELAEAIEAGERGERAFELGLLGLEDRNRLKAIVAQARSSFEQMTELRAKELATLRSVFALDTDATFETSGDWRLSEGSPSETLGLAAALERAMLVTPEARQMDQLIEAAKSEKWQTVFGFFGGAGLSLGQGAGGGLTPSLGNLSAGASFGFGASMIPAIRLSQMQVEALELRRQELELETRAALEGLQAELASTRARLANAGELEKALLSSYRAARLRLELGLVTINELQAAEGAWREAFVGRLAAESQLSLARVAWSRVMQEGPFATLTPCVVPQSK